MQEEQKKVKDVLEFIKASEHGVSIQDVARKFGMSRYDANRVLGILVGMEKVGYEKVGPVMLHFVRKENKQSSKGGE